MDSSWALLLHSRHRLAGAREQDLELLESQAKPTFHGDLNVRQSLLRSTALIVIRLPEGLVSNFYGECSQSSPSKPGSAQLLKVSQDTIHVPSLTTFALGERRHGPKAPKE